MAKKTTNIIPNLSFLQIALIIIIIVVMGYLLGLMIVNIVDKRLSEIAINIPKQDVVVNMNEHFTSKKKLKKQLSKPAEYNPYDNLIDEENLKFINATDDIKNICFKNHEHNNCNHGLMNYGEPIRMSQLDKNAFKYSFNCDKCTLQDYINWLYMYLQEPFDLPYSHRRNLKKLQEGKKIKSIPKLNLKLNSIDYFNKLFNSGGFDSNLFKSKDKYEGANIKDYGNQFSKI